MGVSLSLAQAITRAVLRAAIYAASKQRLPEAFPVYVSPKHIFYALDLDESGVPAPEHLLFITDPERVWIKWYSDSVVREVLRDYASIRLIASLLLIKDTEPSWKIAVALLQMVCGLTFKDVGAVIGEKLATLFEDPVYRKSLRELFQAAVEARRDIALHPEKYPVGELLRDLESAGLSHVAAFIRRALTAIWRTYAQIWREVASAPDQAVVMGLTMAAVRELAILLFLRYLIRYVKVALRSGLSPRILARISRLLDLGYKILAGTAEWFSTVLVLVEKAWSYWWEKILLPELNKLLKPLRVLVDFTTRVVNTYYGSVAKRRFAESNMIISHTCQSLFLTRFLIG